MVSRGCVMGRSNYGFAAVLETLQYRSRAALISMARTSAPHTHSIDRWDDTTGSNLYEHLTGIVPKTMTLPSERPHIRAHNLCRAGRGGAQCARRMHVWLRQWKWFFDNSQTRPQAIDRAFPVLPAYHD